jgi:hypothetical protein
MVPIRVLGSKRAICPEFAMYMPGMGGNFKLGLVNGKDSKWITEASKINTKYVLGTMQYEIQDLILGQGKLFVDVVAFKRKRRFYCKSFRRKYF